METAIRGNALKILHKKLDKVNKGGIFVNEEKQQSASFFQELGCFMKPYQTKYVVSVFVSILSVASNMVAYACTGMIVAMLFQKDATFSSVIRIAFIAIICKLLHALLLNLSTWISHQAAYLTLKDIRRAIAKKMVLLPMGYFEEHGSGRLKTMMVDHIEGMEKTLAHMLPELTANLLGPLVCMIWMFFIDWRLSLCVIIWIILGFSVTGGLMKGYEEKYAGQIKALKGMNQAIVEYVNGIEVIKNFGRADACYKKYQDAVYHHAQYNVNWQKETQKYSSLGMAIAPFSLFPVLIFGLIFYMNHTLAPDTLFMIVILTFGIFTPLMNAMTYFDQLAGMGTNAKEIKDVLDYPELKRGDKTTIEHYDITFDHVDFAYRQSEKLALHDVNLKMKEQSMLALVGPSGSGKSTIAKLLAGFWDVKNGTIRIGGIPIDEYSQEALNKSIAYVDQDTFLFDKSILENIRMGNPDATDEEVYQVAKKAGIDGFIKDLPQGYLTQAGSCGSRLSGGERQRIAIARAMIKDAPIMILDEATASNDPENEASIQRALSAAAKGKTLLVVAHRLQTIVNADQIVFVKDGSIKASGTHEQLLHSCDEYNDMWKIWEGNDNDANI